LWKINDNVNANCVELNSTNNALCVELNSTNNANCVELNSTNNANCVELNSTNNASALFVEFNDNAKNNALYFLSRADRLYAALTVLPRLSSVFIAHLSLRVLKVEIFSNLGLKGGGRIRPFCGPKQGELIRIRLESGTDPDRILRVKSPKTHVDLFRPCGTPQGWSKKTISQNHLKAICTCRVKCPE
jgi:hypothetical protein